MYLRMEEKDRKEFIIIGKYWISKTIMMSEPCQLYVTNIETQEVKIYYEFKMFELLKKEGLDPEPLHEYFDIIHGTTKKDRIKALKYFEIWEERDKK
jgi:hypothetical protein